MNPASRPGSRRRPYFIAALLLVLTLMVFQRVGHQNFVCWDDSLHVSANPHLGSLAQTGFFWRHPYGGLYIPLSYTAYALVAQFARLSAFGALSPYPFHWTNLALHLLNTLLVFVILRRLLRLRDWPAGAGALLFGIHPFQVESVAWISEMRGLLCASFSLLALWLWIAQPRRFLVTATAAFVLALLCKPSAVALPLVVLALDHWILGRPWRRSLPPMLGWLAVSLVWLGVTRSAQPLPFAVTQPLWTRPLIAGDALWFYGTRALWPAHLGPDYGRTPDWVMHRTWMIGLVPLALTALLWLTRRSVLVGAAAVFTLSLLPVLGLVPFAFQLYSTVADRYVYLALLGPALALGWALSQCETSPKWRVASAALCVLGLAGLGWRSVVQVRTWDNALTFTDNALAVNPQSWIMHYNRGLTLERQGKEGGAVTEYQEALRLRPDMADAHGNLGMTFLRQGRDGEADVELQSALRLDPTLTEARNALALSLADQGRTQDAVAQWRLVAQDWPQSVPVRFNLGTALLQLGRTQEAAAEFQATLRLQPQFGAARVALAQATRHPAVAHSRG